MRPPVYAEDLVPGTVHDLGEHRVSLEEIVEFSRQWDPQDFHDAQSESGYFAGTIASGLHSMAVLQRLSVLHLYQDWAVLAGRRIADVRFYAPVRPGMLLHGSLVVQAVDLGEPRRALVTVGKTLTSDGEVVLTAVHELYLFRRPDVDGIDTTV